MRQARGVYVTEPEVVSPLLLSATEELDVEVAFTMSTKTTSAIFSSLTADQTEIVMLDGSQYQIVDSMRNIANWTTTKIKKFQYACFLRKERTVLVWHDDFSEILGHGEALERIFLGMIWGKDPSQLFRPSAPDAGLLVPSPWGSASNISTLGKQTTGQTVQMVDDFTDEEKAAWSQESLARPVYRMSSIFVALAVVLITVILLGFYTSELLQESMIDGKWIRMVLVLTTPIFGSLRVVLRCGYLHGHLPDDRPHRQCPVKFSLLLGNQA